MTLARTFCVILIHRPSHECLLSVRPITCIRQCNHRIRHSGHSLCFIRSIIAVECECLPRCIRIRIYILTASTKDREAICLEPNNFFIILGIALYGVALVGLHFAVFGKVGNVACGGFCTCDANLNVYHRLRLYLFFACVETNIQQPVKCLAGFFTLCCKFFAVLCDLANTKLCIFRKVCICAVGYSYGVSTLGHGLGHLLFFYSFFGLGVCIRSLFRCLVRFRFCVRLSFCLGFCFRLGLGFCTLGLRFGRLLFVILICVLNCGFIRQIDHTDQSAIVCGNVCYQYLIVNITFNYHISRYFACLIADNFRYDADMVCIAIAVCVKEQDIACCYVSNRCEDTSFLQSSRPCISTCALRDFVLRNSCIMQTEGYEHRVPLTIRIAIPCAIAVVTHLGLAIVCDTEVLFTLRIANLTLCNCQNIFCIIAGQLSWKGSFPYIVCFQICLNIGITCDGMRVLFLTADHHLFITFLRMYMSGLFVLSADQSGLIAAVIMSMLFFSTHRLIGKCDTGAVQVPCDSGRNNQCQHQKSSHHSLLSAMIFF